MTQSKPHPWLAFGRQCMALHFFMMQQFKHQHHRPYSIDYWDMRALRQASRAMLYWRDCKFVTIDIEVGTDDRDDRGEAFPWKLVASLYQTFSKWEVTSWGFRHSWVRTTKPHGRLIAQIHYFVVLTPPAVQSHMVPIYGLIRTQ